MSDREPCHYWQPVERLDLCGHCRHSWGAKHCYSWPDQDRIKLFFYVWWPVYLVSVTTAFPFLILWACTGSQDLEASFWIALPLLPITFLSSVAANFLWVPVQLRVVVWFLRHALDWVRSAALLVSGCVGTYAMLMLAPPVLFLVLGPPLFAISIFGWARELGYIGLENQSRWRVTREGVTFGGFTRDGVQRRTWPLSGSSRAQEDWVEKSRIGIRADPAAPRTVLSLMQNYHLSGAGSPRSPTGFLPPVCDWPRGLT
jgi:hypothetical protein